MHTTSTPKILTPSEAAALAANLSRLSLEEKLEALELLDKISAEIAKAMRPVSMSNEEFVKQPPRSTKIGVLYPAIIRGRQHWVSIPDSEVRE